MSDDKTKDNRIFTSFIDNEEDKKPAKKDALSELRINLLILTVISRQLNSTHQRKLQYMMWIMMLLVVSF